MEAKFDRDYSQDGNLRLFRQMFGNGLFYMNGDDNTGKVPNLDPKAITPELVIEETQYGVNCSIN